jgi:acyl dehydratase
MRSGGTDSAEFARPFKKGYTVTLESMKHDVEPSSTDTLWMAHHHHCHWREERG